MARMLKLTSTTCLTKYFMMRFILLIPQRCYCCSLKGRFTEIIHNDSARFNIGDGNAVAGLCQHLDNAEGGDRVLNYEDFAVAHKGVLVDANSIRKVAAGDRSLYISARFEVRVGKLHIYLYALIGRIDNCI